MIRQSVTARRRSLDDRSRARGGVARPVRVVAGDPGTGDWPMWGGTPDRNMVSSMKDLPTEWDVKTKKNVKWVAELGSQSYGNPVVAGGMVFVGTNNEALRDPNQGGDRGVLMAFRESDGEFMWQQTHAKLESGRANDWPFQGVASSPLVEGEQLYYVSNRGVVWCLDIKGFTRRRERRSDHGREADRAEGRRRDLVVRHDGRGRHLSAQPGQLVAGHLGRPDLRQHVQRPGREPRQHPVAAGAGDHRAQQDDRQAGLGGQLGRGPHPPRPVVDADGRRRSAASSRSISGAGRRLGPRLRGRDRQEAVGVRHQPEGLGLAAHAQRDHRDAGHLQEPRLHRQRTGSGARRRRRPLLRDRRRPSAATSPRPAWSSTSTRSAGRSRRRRSSTISSTSPTSAASSTASTRRPGRSTGCTT